VQVQAKTLTVKRLNPEDYGGTEQRDRNVFYPDIFDENRGI
jgi:hypothetical protein